MIYINIWDILFIVSVSPCRDTVFKSASASPQSVDEKVVLVQISVANALAALGSQHSQPGADLTSSHAASDAANAVSSAEVVGEVLDFILQKGVINKSADVRNAILLAVEFISKVNQNSFI